MTATADLRPRGDKLTTYTFKIAIEPDEDRWRAYSPTLEHLGAATWGYTREEALRHIREVLELVVAELVEDGEPVPVDAQASEEPLVSVTVCVGSTGDGSATSPRASSPPPWSATASSCARRGTCTSVTGTPTAAA
jgi:predicted RNase H-like HicB family nuclease